MSGARFAGLGLGLAVALSSLGCEEEECKIPDVYLNLPVSDQTLQPLIDACAADGPPGPSACAGIDAGSSYVNCKCLPLCRRLLDLAQLSSSGGVGQCELFRDPSTGVPRSVHVTPMVCVYRD